MDSYQENGGVTDDGDDPFNEAIEPLPLGQAYYKLEGLAYLMDNPATVSIIGQNSRIMGKLEINVIPVDIDGESEIPEDMIPDSPDELIDQRMDFIVQISRAFELPEDFCKDIFCEYSLFLGDEKFTTTTVLGKCREPQFDYRYHHTIDICTDYFIKYITNEQVSLILDLIPLLQLCIKVYGFPDFKYQEEKEKKPKKTNKAVKTSKLCGNTSLDRSKGGNDSTFENTFNNQSSSSFDSGNNSFQP